MSMAEKRKRYREMGRDEERERERQRERESSWPDAHARTEMHMQISIPVPWFICLGEQTIIKYIIIARINCRLHVGLIEVGQVDQKTRPS